MIKIANKNIKPTSTFIIAELSCNHLGKLETALKTIEAVAEAGADALKVQTMLPETMTLKCDKDNFIIKGGTLWDNRTFFDLYTQTTLPWEWHKPIKEKCKQLGLVFFSTPFGMGYDDISDPTDFLEDLGVPCYKIASFEITDIPFIKHVASKQKPVIISTGIAQKEDIELAVSACKEVGNNNIILLKCTSAYPTPLEDVNLLTMAKIAKDFDCLVGISDHTIDNEVAIASIALGGCVIEKHVILDRKLGGPDAEFSIEPHELKQLVISVRKTEKLIGKATYELTGKQKKSKQFARSLYAVKDIKRGEMITKDNTRSIRPGNGLHPKYYHDIINTKSPIDIKFGDPLSEQLLQNIK